MGATLRPNPLVLNTGRVLPHIGFGLWKIAEADVSDLVVQAAKVGYRHFDSASDYGNEAGTGNGLQRVIQSGICRREELWVTSKLWNTYHRPEHVLPALKKTLFDLKLDYLDLYLIHFPIALQFIPFEQRYPASWYFDPENPKLGMRPDHVPISHTWEAMEELVSAGLVRDLGVSNFGVSLLRDLTAHARIRPAVLQVELHPYLTQQKLLRYCRDANIVVTGFSPLGAESYFSLGMAQPGDSVLQDEVILKIASRLGRTPGQVVLRWGIQRGTAIVPKTVRPERVIENLNLFDFQLSEADMNSINQLDRHRRFNDPGDFCEAAFGTFFPIYE